jgi:hypothetical protein
MLETDTKQYWTLDSTENRVQQKTEDLFRTGEIASNVGVGDKQVVALIFVLFPHRGLVQNLSDLKQVAKKKTQ